MLKSTKNGDLIMRRYNPPFNGNQFVLNKATGEIHDLDNEKPQCQIDEINPDNVMNCIDYENAWFRALVFHKSGANGCYYCLKSKDNG